MERPSSIKKTRKQEKIKGKRRGQPATCWMDSITAVLGALLEDLKDQVRDGSSWTNLSMWYLRVNTNVMAHNTGQQRFFFL